ncbi:MAG: ornithine cyclodeaminase family protein [Pseudomonadota bacterium]|nr:ornithine cyclodeaminase family protein [Pseudomonadota bacterium]
MRVVSAEEIARALTFPDLIAALDGAFRAEIATPLRHHHAIPRPGEPEAMLLLMPAWETGSNAAMGVKVVTVFPGNAERGKATVTGVYLLLDGATGEPLATLDGRVLTLWRTAAASALAARRLARRDAQRLVMVGAGALAPYLIRAHASVRPVSEVLVWNRTAASAEALVRDLDLPGVTVRAAGSLEEAVAGADIVSCATLSREPLVHGVWLKPGAHLDLVGGFTPTMREADDEAVRRARLFCDTRAGALREAGDLADPLARGLIAESDIAADLFDLARGRSPGRERDDEITLFKSVGTAIEDLAAAALVFRRLATQA